MHHSAETLSEAEDTNDEHDCAPNDPHLADTSEVRGGGIHGVLPDCYGA